MIVHALQRIKQLYRDSGPCLADAERGWHEGQVAQSSLYGDVHPPDEAFDSLRSQCYQELLQDCGLCDEDLLIEVGCGPLNRRGDSRLSRSLPQHNLLPTDCSYAVASASGRRRGFERIDLNDEQSLSPLRHAKAVIGLNVFNCHPQEKLTAWAQALSQSINPGTLIIALSDLHPFLDAAAADFIAKQPNKLHLPYLRLKDQRVSTHAMLSVEADPELLALQASGRLYNRYCQLAAASIHAAQPYLDLQAELVQAGAEITALHDNARASLHAAFASSELSLLLEGEKKQLRRVKRSATGLASCTSSPPGKALVGFHVAYDQPTQRVFAARGAAPELSLSYRLAYSIAVKR